MDRARLFSFADELVGVRFVQRQMGAALQVVLGQASLPQQGSDSIEMGLLGIVRGAGHGEFLIREPELVGCPGENQWEGLERFARGSRIDVGLGVADGFQQVAFRVADGETTAVDALHERAAPDGHEGSILGQSSLVYRRVTHQRDE
jgi:hypothetical protein